MCSNKLVTYFSCYCSFLLVFSECLPGQWHANTVYIFCLYFFVATYPWSVNPHLVLHMTEEALVMVTTDNTSFILSAVSLGLRQFCYHRWLVIWDTVSLCCPFCLLVYYCLWLVSRPHGSSPFLRTWSCVPFSVHTLWFWDKASLHRLARNSWSSCPRFLS